MTREELERVRRLRETLRSKENKIKTLRSVLSNLVPVYDGMPPMKANSSTRENLLVKILDLEGEVEGLKETLAAEQNILTEKICAADLNGRETALMIRRYVFCQRFRDIGFEMNLSEATTFRVHDAALEKLTVL